MARATGPSRYRPASSSCRWPSMGPSKRRIAKQPRPGTVSSQFFSLPAGALGAGRCEGGICPSCVRSVRPARLPARRPSVTARAGIPLMLHLAKDSRFNGSCARGDGTPELAPPKRTRHICRRLGTATCDAGGPRMAIGRRCGVSAVLPLCSVLARATARRLRWRRA